MALVGADGRALDELASIVGAEHARLAQADDTIDGVAARLVVAPGSVAETSQVLRLAYERGLAVAPRGAGTMLDWGNPPHRVDIIVEMWRLNRILEHAAGDLVARVEAGVTLGQLQQTLAAADQFLALDPPPLRLTSGDWVEDTRTLGGIIAANASGPRRLRYGTVRDLLIGITVVLADGTVARAGGKVVKNVAGYDLGKLYTGSYGTLGLIVEAIFRLHPLPPARRAVSLMLSDPDTVQNAVYDVMQSTLVPSALQVHWSGGYGELVILFEGAERGVDTQAEACIALLERHGKADVAEARTEGVSWGGNESTFSFLSKNSGVVGLVVTTVPNDLGNLLRFINDEIQPRGILVRATSQAAVGVTFVGFRHRDAQTSIDVVRTLRASIARRDGSVVVRQAPVDLKKVVDVWGEVGDALPLMRRVKEQFDPTGIMNPGRFVGGI